MATAVATDLIAEALATRREQLVSAAVDAYAAFDRPADAERCFKRERPDAVVMIDNPEFNLRLAKKAKKRKKGGRFGSARWPR